MQLALDHIVHFLHRSPAEPVEQFRQHGYHAVAGGRHVTWGTWNSLSYFGLSYVEFLSVELPEIAANSDNPLIRQLVGEQNRGEGLGQIALRTREMDQWAEHFAGKGLQVTGPVAGSRKRDDGTVIRWRMLFLRDPDSGLVPPFLIEWEADDAERKHDLTQRGVIAAHPNGAAAVDSIVYATTDLDEAASRWQHWFDWQSGDVYLDDLLGARCRKFSLSGGDVVLCEPVRAGIAQEALDSRGERPFAVRIAGAAKEGLDQVYGGYYVRMR
ncbi:VOC family protein [Brevibacillus sp. GCM10020057]|uniref:VOC family protein n=1 Tax=Brevibacillus sp. GCM10020057 TaxID=3317327 RepID=UPI0036290FD4